MANLTNLLDKLAKNTRVRSNIEEAREIYEEKPFVSEYEHTYRIAKQFGFIPSLISIASTSLIFTQAFPNLHIATAILIGLLLATGFEVLKEHASSAGFEYYFKKKKFSFVLLGSVLMYLLSVCMSTFGTYNAYKVLESSTEARLDSSQEKNSLEMSKSFDQKIAKAQEKADNYFDQVSWKGKISHKNAKVYNSLLESVSKLEDQKQEALSKLSLASETSKDQELDGLGNYLYILIGLSLFIEGLIFCISRFKRYYPYKTHTQIEMIKESETVPVLLQDIPRLLDLLMMGQDKYNLSFQGETDRKEIGFKTPKNAPVQGKTHDTRSSDRSTTVEKSNPLAERSCDHCGTLYKPKVSWQRFCSKPCNHAHNNFKLKS